MATRGSKPAGSSGEAELVITRVIDAPRPLVFRAWTEPEHFMRWWGPKGFTVPFCKINLRAGGLVHFCMRSPEGQDIWARGVYREVVPPERIVSTDSFSDEKGNVVSPTKYGMGTDWPTEAVVTVTFEEQGNKTKVTLHQSVPLTLAKRYGAVEGWTETLDRLAEYAPKAAGGSSAGRSVQHATFVVERTFAASPAKVFHAWSDPAAKARWMRGPEDWEAGKHELDFRVGGRERESGGPKGGAVHTYEARYHDIVPNARIVYAYDMHLDEKRISVSLATVELAPAGVGTKMTYTEQGAFLDGADRPAAREQGMGGLFDNLDAALRRDSKAS